MYPYVLFIFISVYLWKIVNDNYNNNDENQTDHQSLMKQKIVHYKHNHKKNILGFFTAIRLLQGDQVLVLSEQNTECIVYSIGKSSERIFYYCEHGIRVCNRCCAFCSHEGTKLSAARGVFDTMGRYEQQKELVLSPCIPFVAFVAPSPLNQTVVGISWEIPARPGSTRLFAPPTLV